MFEPDDAMTIATDDDAAGRDAAPAIAGSHTCPHCSWVNWCTFDAGHSGNCHCDQGHYWAGNH